VFYHKILTSSQIEKGLKNITLQQMKALIHLIEERSFSRAAERMLLTQSALTKNIRNIEDYLEVKIVHRSNSGVSLTNEGKIIFDYAQRITRLQSEASDKIRRLRDNPGSDIYLAASSLPATYILPCVLSEFKKKHADIRIFMNTEDDEEVINIVLESGAEIGCICKKPQNTELIAEQILQDRLILVVPNGHRWIKKGAVDLSELLEEPFILQEKWSATRNLFESYLKTNKGVDFSQFNISVELGSSAAIKEAVLAGFGVSVLSIHAVGRELTSKVLFEIPVTSCEVERRIYLIYLKQFEFPIQHRIFVEYLKNYSALTL